MDCRTPTTAVAAGLRSPEDGLRRRRVRHQPGVQVQGVVCSAVICPQPPSHTSPSGTCVCVHIVLYNCHVLKALLPHMRPRDWPVLLACLLACPARTAVCVLPLALCRLAGPIFPPPGLDQVESHLQIHTHPCPSAHRPPPRCLSHSCRRSPMSHSCHELLPCQQQPSFAAKALHFLCCLHCATRMIVFTTSCPLIDRDSKVCNARMDTAATSSTSPAGSFRIPISDLSQLPG